MMPLMLVLLKSSCLDNTLWKSCLLAFGAFKIETVLGCGLGCIFRCPCFRDFFSFFSIGSSMVIGSSDSLSFFVLISPLFLSGWYKFLLRPGRYLLTWDCDARLESVLGARLFFSLAPFETGAWRFFGCNCSCDGSYSIYRLGSVS